MNLPNGENAIVEERKLSDYLLSEMHPVGRAKARYFRKLGFSNKNAKEFKDILLRIANSTPVSQQIDTTYGTKYIIKAEIPASSDKIYTLVTIWIIEKNEENPKFVTAYPATK